MVSGREVVLHEARRKASKVVRRWRRRLVEGRRLLVRREWSSEVRRPLENITSINQYIHLSIYQNQRRANCRTVLLFQVSLMSAASPYLDAWRERRLPLAPWRLIRLVPPRWLLLVRVPRGGARVGSTRTAPGTAAPFPGRTPAPVHRLPLVVPHPLVAVPGRAGRGGLVGVKGRLGDGRARAGNGDVIKQT